LNNAQELEQTHKQNPVKHMPCKFHKGAQEMTKHQ